MSTMQPAPRANATGDGHGFRHARRNPEGCRKIARLYTKLAWMLVATACLDTSSIAAAADAALPTQITTPGTQALAAIGLGVLVLHILRRRRHDTIQKPKDQPEFDDEAEWQRRIALWEERIGGDAGTTSSHSKNAVSQSGSSSTARQGCMDDALDKHNPRA
ncbi:MAG TPA: hypothetical protein DIW77_11325 [Chromatiaceae bacterium]|nr:hypothetical protein [Chromatiaceae bacterium]